MGGTGKGLVANALKQVRVVAKIDGKKFDGRDRFCFQNIKESTQIVWIDDIAKKFGFDRLNSVLTDGYEVEQKGKDAVHYPPGHGLKTYLCANIIMEGSGTTRKRRQFIIEYDDFYSKKISKGTEEPIVEEHNGEFFSPDWSEHDWNQFYSFMLASSQYYHEYGLVGYETKNVAENRLRQTTSEEFAEWIEERGLTDGVPYKTQELFTPFKKLYFPDDDDFKQKKFTLMVKKYAALKSWKSKCYTDNSINYIKFTKI